MSFILNHFFKTLSLLLHVSIAYRLSSSGSCDEAVRVIELWRGSICVEG